MEIQVLIEKAEQNYSAVTLNLGGVCIAGTGATIQATIDDIKDAIAFYIETCREGGDPIPRELQGDYSLSYEMPMESYLDFCSTVFTKTGMAEITGINSRIFSRYQLGQTKPRKKQRERIEEAMHALADTLKAITITT